MKTPSHKDPLAELAAEALAHGLCHATGRPEERSSGAMPT